LVLVSDHLEVHNKPFLLIHFLFFQQWFWSMINVAPTFQNEGVSDTDTSLTLVDVVTFKFQLYHFFKLLSVSTCQWTPCLCLC
jgi:hypothetical protein